MDAWTFAANLSTLIALVVGFAGVWLAWQTARDQRHNRDFPSDKADADKFDRRAAAVIESSPAGRSIHRRTCAYALDEALAQFGPPHRRDRRAEFKSMMARHIEEAGMILRAAPNSPLTFEEAARVHALIDRARWIAEEWAYPERRADMMRAEYATLYADTLAAGTSMDYPLDIQVHRWMLTGHPSDIQAVQAVRVASNWTDRLCYDLARGRLPQRWRDWQHGRRERAISLATVAAHEAAGASLAAADIGDDGLPPGRDCPTCGEPLQPGHIDDTTGIAWMCPNHGAVDLTPDPLHP